MSHPRLPGLSLPLLLLLCGLLLTSCSPPTVPDMQVVPQRYVDELQWYEFGELEDVSGAAGDSGWIAAALSDQLSGQNLLLPFEQAMLVPGVADIQLEYDNFPLPAAWHSPPGELAIDGGSGLLEHTIQFSHDPSLPPSQQVVELISMRGSFQLAPAHSVMRQAEEGMLEQPLAQTNPETRERWLLGRSATPLTVIWEIEGSLGGVPCSFSASQQLTAVSSYYELLILQPGDPAVPLTELRHLSLLAAAH